MILNALGEPVKIEKFVPHTRITPGTEVITYPEKSYFYQGLTVDPVPQSILDEAYQRGYDAGYDAGVENGHVDLSEIKKTLLLLHGDDLTDSSIFGQSITNNGVTVSTAQSKFGGKSLYFNGTNAYLQFPCLLTGNKPFTIECWIYPTAQGSKTVWSHGGSNATATTGGVVEFYTNRNFIYYCSGFLIQSSATFALNTWHHVAIVGESNSIKIYVNGSLVGTYNGSYNFGNYNEVIGANASAFGSENFTGYMDEIRISNVARWTSNFTPPTEAYSM